MPDSVDYMYEKDISRRCEMVLPEFVRVSSFCIVFVQFKKNARDSGSYSEFEKKEKIKLWPETVRTVSAVLQNSILSLFFSE